MALQKPIVNVISAFDATESKTITFQVNGGDQVTANKCIVTLVSTNTVVYEATQTTFNLEHTIPANTLTNGQYYILQIQTLNTNSDISPISSPVTFYCYSTPTFEFSNLPTDNIIPNVEYNFELSYNQTEGESLTSYIINVYGIGQNLIWSSGTMYVGSNGVPPALFSANVSGFTDNNSYYIRALGQTEQLTVLDTGMITLTTQFNSKNIYTSFDLENHPCEGYITINSRIISLDGKTNPENPIYIDDQEIDLRNSEYYVTWENSFGVYETYTLRLWAREPNANSILATIYSSTNPEVGMTIYEREVVRSGTTYMWIEAFYKDSQGFEGYIYSDEIEKPNKFMVWIQKLNGLYDISVEEVE